MNKKSRRNEFELFTHNRKTYCFDDASLDAGPAVINADPAMFAWLRSQPGCRPMDDTDVAYYLDAKTYLVWKLKWT